MAPSPCARHGGEPPEEKRPTEHLFGEFSKITDAANTDYPLVHLILTRPKK